MSTLIWTIVIILAILFFASITSTQKVATNPYGRRQNVSIIFVVAFALVLIVAEGFRNSFEDTNNYKGIFSSLPSDFSTAINSIPSVEKGYLAFCWIIKEINNNSQFFIFICAIIIVTCDMLFIGKYSTDIVFSLFLSFTISFISSMNGIRQILASLILMGGFSLIEKKKWYLYIPLAFIASYFHKSALITIPLYFAVSRKRFNIGIILICAFSVTSLIIPSAAQALINLFADKYASYSQYEAGANIFHVIVELVPVALSIIYHQQVLKQNPTAGLIESGNQKTGLNPRLVDILINMQLVTASFMLMATRMAQYARVNAYYRNCTAVLMPFLIQYCFQGQNQRLVRILAYIGYFAYFAVVTYMELPLFNEYFLNFSIF